MRNKIKHFGIGVDIEKTSRFKKLNRIKHSNFLNKIFTEQELAYCFSKEKPPRHLAARYTAKEAIIKALSGITRARLIYSDIEILKSKKGAPIAKINKRYLSNVKISVSLSHCRDRAIAFAVAIKTSHK